MAELAKRHRRGVHSHLVLLTDGQTYGDEEACIAEARRAGAQGIGISALGIGADWNDVVLDAIALHSGGVSAYIDSPDQAQALLRERVQGLSAAYAQGLSLTVQPAPTVQVEMAFRVLPVLGRLVPTRGAMALGTLQADSPLEVLLELGVGPRAAGPAILATLTLTKSMGSNGLFQNEMGFEARSTKPV